MLLHSRILVATVVAAVGVALVLARPSPLRAAAQAPPRPGVHVSNAAKGRGEMLADFFGTAPELIAIAAILGATAAVALAAAWWTDGRDRWLGDISSGDASRERIKPLLAHETIVVEYQPPLVPDHSRRLRPAEVGLLLDERVDTVDLTATVVDLAGRGYVEIKDLPRTGILDWGDYDLVRLDRADGDLLPFERQLLQILFAGGRDARLTDLAGHLVVPLRRVRYEVAQGMVEMRLFPRDPEAVRAWYQNAGAIIGGIGGAAILVLGQAAGIGLLAAPVFLAGIALFAFSHTMPRRTGLGRETYRRILGFSLYIRTAERDRQQFAERQHIFDDYLPYAMVFGSVHHWAAAFAGLDRDYVRRPSHLPRPDETAPGR